MSATWLVRGEPLRPAEVTKVRRSVQPVILLLIVAIVAALSGQPPDYNRPVTVEMQNQPFDRVFQSIAEQMGVRLLCPVPTANHTTLDWPPNPLSLSCDQKPAFEALEQTGAEWKLVGDLLLVVPARDEFVECAVRQEFLLEHASAEELLARLRVWYPRARLTPHPTMNGFYMSGLKRDLLRVKRSLPELDKNPPPHSPPVVTDRYEMAHLSPEEAAERLRSEQPNLQVQIIDGGVLVTGKSEELALAEYLLDHRDMTTLMVPVALEAVAKSPPRCTVQGVGLACEPDCKGPLHLLGLKPGDQLRLTESLRSQPEWRINRDGQELRILLEVQ